MLPINMAANVLYHSIWLSPDKFDPPTQAQVIIATVRDRPFHPDRMGDQFATRLVDLAPHGPTRKPETLIMSATSRTCRPLPLLLSPMLRKHLLPSSRRSQSIPAVDPFELMQRHAPTEP
jgi:hypothetical protein